MGSRSVSSAGRKATSKMKSAATRRRMSSKASADVAESVDEIARIESELEDLAEDMQDEVDRIAEASQDKALKIEEVGVRANKTDIAVREIFVLWE
jgi:putative heme iron utilization protein